MFDSSYRRLGDAYSVLCAATPVSQPQWMAFNHSLAQAMDWPQEWRETDEALSALAGNSILTGSTPYATVYAGHQFGSYNPQLGDGRALLLGEWCTKNGKRLDVQLKGAGRTPFSRGGDGRSPIGPVVREYLLSEAMAALGVPTTRALAAVATGDPVLRQGPEPGGILTRVASSHLRIGTIQYFAMSKGGDGVAELVNHITSRHFQEELEQSSAANPGTTQVLLKAVCKRLASLVAQWQSLGFIHGVLNTDNMLLCGETVDYGPCAFMDNYAADRVFSSIDTGGRYAFQNQPGIVHWNLSVLAQCLLPLMHDDEEKALQAAQHAIDLFPRLFSDTHGALLARKFGLGSFRESDRALVDKFFKALAEGNLDFTLAFRWLTEVAGGTLDHTPLPELFKPSVALLTWLEDWRATRGQRGADNETTLGQMQEANPVVIPRNHRVAEAISAAELGDYRPISDYHNRWQTPYEWGPDDTWYAASPEPEARITRTFCGT